MGEKVNIGAVGQYRHYDGVNKHQTVIGDRTKVGANSVLSRTDNFTAQMSL
jgi:bifunctional UDP-N-acetylglucosamine pyrophosphorylase/glucosamine-1-phosphate N-acetyltransferase